MGKSQLEFQYEENTITSSRCCQIESYLCMGLERIFLIAPPIFSEFLMLAALTLTTKAPAGKRRCNIKFLPKTLK